MIGQPSPGRASQVCTIHGCPEIATHGNRCTEHKRPPRPGRGSTYRWRQIRKQVLDRDGYQCTYRADGNRCPNTEHLQVHHILPVAQGGKDTPDNCRVLCHTHHVQIHR